MFPISLRSRARIFLPALVCAILTSGLSAEETPRYLDPRATLTERVDDLFGKLTQDEKLSLLTGTGFTTHAIERLGVPAMSMVDAGQGVRGGMKTTHGPATAFPSGVAMASTFDVGLIRRIAQAIGEETRNKGTGSQVLLGPAVNIQRSPLGGRNGEYFSEDPFLAARLAVAYIQGMQGTGVAACIKHYACNNEEDDRMYVDVRVSERALREIYLPAFEAGVKEGKVWALMSAYNKVNGPHASANSYLLQTVLKQQWGFDGLVMSDWGGVHETAVAQAGNDLEMPGGKYATPDKLAAALADGSLTQAAVDDSAKRVLGAVIRVGLLDHPPAPDPAMMNSPQHQAIALEAAQKAIVLLKNEGAVLPVDRRKVKSIAVIGEPAQALQIGALGSPEVHPFQSTQILEGIQKLAGPGINVTYVPGTADLPLTAEFPGLTLPGGEGHGFKATYFAGQELSGPPLLERADAQIQLDTTESPVEGVPATNYSVRWVADLKADKTGVYRFSFTGDDGFRVKVDSLPIIQRWNKGPSTRVEGTAQLEAGTVHTLEIEYFQAAGDAVAQLNWAPPTETPYADAIAAAKAADLVVLCAGTHRSEGEGHDRPSMDLPNNQAAMIQAVAAANKNTVVVLNNGTPVTMTAWVAEVPTILEAWFPGQSGGQAVADVLFGEVNPSGKLPTTLAAQRTDYPDANNFPGKEGKVLYDEGIYIGYRYFDKKDIDPVFPFGHGLSYTTFTYRNARLDGLNVTVDVTNTGSRAGDEIVQLYVRDPQPKIDRPIRELKGFARVSLQPGETKPVTFTLKPRDLAYFDVEGKQWKADAGAYEIELGASSRDIRGKATYKLEKEFTEPVGG